MAEKIAQTHRNKSNRAKLQDSIDRKTVYKSVLDTPFRIPWPSVPMNVQNAFLARVLSLLDGVFDYQMYRQRKRRREKSLVFRARKKQKPSSDSPVNINPSEVVHCEESSEQPQDDALDPPPLLHHLTIGINEVTKSLEDLVKLSRHTVSSSQTSDTQVNIEASSHIVLVCQADIDPPILAGHLPHLIASCNTVHRHPGSATSQKTVWLVPLPKGAEASLAEALGLRRVAVMAIKSSAPDFSAFQSLLESVPVLRASWLNKPDFAEQPMLLPTHIKQLCTTAPKDMKAAKERRAQGRAASKQRRKERHVNGKIPKRLSVTT